MDRINLIGKNNRFDFILTTEEMKKFSRLDQGEGVFVSSYGLRPLNG